MAVRPPRFCYENAYRERGVANITLNKAADADFPVDNLIDDRGGTLFKQSATGSLIVAVDLGASFETGYDRIIVPKDHDVNWADALGSAVEDADDSSFTPSTQLLEVTGNAGEQLQLDFTLASSRRYLRLAWFNISAKPQLPQLFVTKIVTFTKPPELAGALDEDRYNYSRHAQAKGVAPSVQHGPARRVLQYRYRDLTGADLTAMEAFIAFVGMSMPFWVDPTSYSTPAGDDEPALWMKFLHEPRAREGVYIATDGTRSKHFDLVMIESLD